ncbi:hypothetical protein R4E93_02755 [Bacteroides ovatus]|uniref:hypothetical protein n=1 Tax=Bacteroides ovatus TaxID=28116 RepID=UPI002952E888|nr:hypothetical protein [Bacteroides ovatus]MDV7050584.1 hypothetical protein [Bacteroides ovatus]
MNRSHFYKEFTKRMGVVPKDYRLHNKSQIIYILNSFTYGLQTHTSCIKNIHLIRRS